MSEITPEPVAATPPTVELVADLLAEADNDYHDGYFWKLRMSASGNVAKIGIEPFADDGGDGDDDEATLLPEVHFRAVVVPGEETPIVSDRATFEQRVNERFDEAARKLGHESLAFMPATIAALRAQILALDVDLAEAAQAEQNGGAAVAEQEPMRIAPTVFMVETEENVGATLVQMIDQDGREVYVGLDDHMRDLLVSMLVRNGGAANV